MKERITRYWNNIKQTGSSLYLFAKRLFVTLIGLSILSLGVYAALKGYTTSETLKHYAFTVSGVCTAADGLWVMFYALVKIK